MNFLDHTYLSVISEAEKEDVFLLQRREKIERRQTVLETELKLCKHPH